MRISKLESGRMQILYSNSETRSIVIKAKDWLVKSIVAQEPKQTNRYVRTRWRPTFEQIKWTKKMDWIE